MPYNHSVNFSELGIIFCHIFKDHQYLFVWHKLARVKKCKHTCTKVLTINQACKIYCSNLFLERAMNYKPLESSKQVLSQQRFSDIKPTQLSVDTSFKEPKCISLYLSLSYFSVSILFIFVTHTKCKSQFLIQELAIEEGYLTRRPSEI